uniref:Uncharacterized protein n=1 Tax=Timema monikensis TaxID=170555 RepID=A0A7R9ENL7_9NEOP|nr:unnamed protein product [Timema monikensis]
MRGGLVGRPRLT